MDLGLRDKVVLVGGASRGLGYAVAEAVAREGARVSIMARDAAAIEEAANRLTASTGAEVVAHSVDVSAPQAIERWVEGTAELWGGIDACLANAGGPPAGDFPAFDDAAWRAAFDLIVLSAVRVARAVIPEFERRAGGSIVFVTSSSTKEPIPNLTLSTVTRASVAALAKDLARQYAGERIRVNHMVPGRIDTARVRKLDRANALQRFWYITLPLIRSAIVIVVILRAVIALSAFAAVYAATGGGPGTATEILNLYAYRTSFTELNFGYGSALAVSLLIITLSVSGILFNLRTAK